MSSALELGMGFDEQGLLEVYAIDGEDGPDDVCAPFMELIDNWIAVESVQGRLHPYFDDTLNMLAMLTHAQQVIVKRMAAHTPCRADMSRVFEIAAGLLERLKEQLR